MPTRRRGSYHAMRQPRGATAPWLTSFLRPTNLDIAFIDVVPPVRCQPLVRAGSLRLARPAATPCAAVLPSEKLCVLDLRTWGLWCSGFDLELPRKGVSWLWVRVG